MERNVNLHVRLNKEEAEILKEKSDEVNASVSEYIRKLITNRPDDYPEIRKLMIDLINEYNKVGVNINQIAKSSQTGVLEPYGVLRAQKGHMHVQINRRYDVR